MFYVNENIPCREISPEQNDSNFEKIFLEITLRNLKWLLICIYKPPGQKEKGFLKNLNSILNKYISKYGNILIGDFSSSVENKHLADSTTLFVLESLIKSPTCFQSSKPTCIDIILANKKELFKRNSKTFEVGISDHHLLTLIRIQFVKGNPKVKFYRDYKSFNFESFNKDLDGLLMAENNMNYSTFQNIFLQVLNTQRSCQEKSSEF